MTTERASLPCKLLGPEYIWEPKYTNSYALVKVERAFEELAFLTGAKESRSVYIERDNGTDELVVDNIMTLDEAMIVGETFVRTGAL
jgi:hypothetical protein